MLLSDLNLNKLLYRDTTTPDTNTVVNSNGTISTAQSSSVGGGSDSGSTETNPETIPSGELAGSLIMLDGFIRSKNYISGSAGWTINADGTAQFAGITLVGGTFKYGKNTFVDSTNAGYIFDTNGMYIGSASDTSYLKYDIGAGTFALKATLIETNNIKAGGSLQGVTFAYNKLNAVGGQLMITNADVLATDMTSADNSTVTTRGDTTFAVNDIIVMRGVTTVSVVEEWMLITDISSAPTYTVTRDLASTYASNSNPAWKAGTPFVKQGQSSSASNVLVLVVAGGGSGGSVTSTEDVGAGGGGGGGVEYNASFSITPQTYTVTVGTGGLSAGVGNLSGNVGNDSIFGSITAKGGGYGTEAATGGNGGSGGGGGYVRSGGNALGSQGNNGGSGGSGTNFGGGGGGGAGAVGGNATTDDGANGGNGVSNSITGSPVIYGGGGGGGFGVGGSTPGGGGTGGGGTAGGNGTANTGGGGAGGSRNQAGGAGGSGIVIISYLTGTLIATGGTITTSGGYTIHTFLTTGTFTVQGIYGGWLRLIGEGTNSPYYSVFQRTGTAYNAYSEVCRLGNLNGFLGYTTDSYGIAIGDSLGYLKYDNVNGLVITNAKGFTVTASANLKHSNDTESGILAYTSATKVREIQYLDSSGVIRVGFDLRNGDSTFSAYGQIYVNGSAVGALHSNSGAGATYATYTDDINVVTGDLIQLYEYNQSTYHGQVKNMRLYYDKNPNKIASINNL